MELKNPFSLDMVEEVLSTIVALISQNQSILTELAPSLASDVPFSQESANRLPRFHGAGPSTSLDEICYSIINQTGRHDNTSITVCQIFRSRDCKQDLSGI